MLGAEVKAMELYESEARQFPHPRSPQALRAIAQKMGKHDRVRTAAEAFELVRSIR